MWTAEEYIASDTAFFVYPRFPYMFCLFFFVCRGLFNLESGSSAFQKSVFNEPAQQHILFTASLNCRLWKEYRIGFTLALAITNISIGVKILSWNSRIAPIKRAPSRIAQGNQKILNAMTMLNITLVMRLRDFVIDLLHCCFWRPFSQEHLHHKCLMIANEVRKIIAIGMI